MLQNGRSNGIAIFTCSLHGTPTVNMLLRRICHVCLSVCVFFRLITAGQN